MTHTDIAYRKSAVAGASGIGLLISLYDTLAGDLRRAAEAQRAKNIEQRSREAAHALLVIGHLEFWLAEANPGELTSKLAAFYVKLRHDLINAQAKQSAEQIEQSMRDVLELSALWQKIESETSVELSPVASMESMHASAYAPQSAPAENSWSA